MGETWFQRLHGTGVSDYYGSYMSIMHMTFVHGFLKFFLAIHLTGSSLRRVGLASPYLTCYYTEYYIISLM